MIRPSFCVPGRPVAYQVLWRKLAGCRHLGLKVGSGGHAKLRRSELKQGFGRRRPAAGLALWAPNAICATCTSGFAPEYLCHASCLFKTCPAHCRPASNRPEKQNCAALACMVSGENLSHDAGCQTAIVQQLQGCKPFARSVPCEGDGAPTAFALKPAEDSLSKPRATCNYAEQCARLWVPC